MEHGGDIPDSLAFQRLRFRMVEEQLAARGLRDRRVLDAMRRVPRHCFVNPADVPRAYEDHPLAIGRGQTISQPYMVALMTELLALNPTGRVLEIGTGSGYQAAILAELAQEVVSVERDPALAASARERLARLGYGRVVVVVGDGTLGCAERAPYDGIVVTAGGPQVPPSLKKQLAPGGRLVCPTGPRDLQRLSVITRTASGLEESFDTACTFVPLIGAEGWPE